MVLGNERYQKRSDRLRVREKVDSLRQRELDLLSSAERLDWAKERAHQELVERVASIEKREARNQSDQLAMESNAETAAALLFQLQRERADHDISTQTLTDRLADCERALHKARLDNSRLREQLAQVEDELHMLRVQDCKKARRLAATRAATAGTRGGGADHAQRSRGSVPLLRHHRGATKWINL